MPSDDLAAFGDELTVFGRSVEDLRAAQRLPPEQVRPVFETAVRELDQAVRRLWGVHRSLSERHSRLPEHTKREAQLLRAVFHEFPLPVLLLDRDTVVRRLNHAASALVGTGPGYASGRPLTGFVAPAHRAEFRSQVSAVARTGESRSVLVSPAASQAASFHMTLVALRPPGESRNTVLALVQTDGRLPLPPHERVVDRLAQPVSASGRSVSQEAARRETVSLDLMDTMTTTLLQAGPADASAVLRQVADVLHARVADWVVGDLLDESGMRRCVAVGPRGEQARALATSLLKQLPDSCPVAVTALESATVSVHLNPEDMEGFGVDEEGTAVLARAGVTSLVCLPLCSAPAGIGVRPVRGVLTLFRTGKRDPFGLAEVAVLDRLSRHVALRLEREHRGNDGA